MSSTKSQRIVGLVGALGSGLFVWLAIRHLDLTAVERAWRDGSPLPWVPLAVLAYVAGHFVRGQRLRLLVQREASLSLTTATNIVVVGYASNDVVPARLGELARAGMLAERTGIPFPQALTVTFIERLFDGIAILMLLVVSTLTAEPTGWVKSLARSGSVIFGIGLLLVLFAVYLPGVLVSVVTRLASGLGQGARDWAIGLATNIVHGAVSVRRPSNALAILFTSVCVWLLESMMFVLVLPAFSLPMHVSTGVMAMSITNLGILVPSLGGSIGPFHYFCSQALMSQGVSPSVAVGYAILVHLTFYVPVSLWGAGSFFWYGVEVGKTAAMARSAQSSPKTDSASGVKIHVIARMVPRPATKKLSEFYLALTEAILPDTGVPPKTLASVATFVNDQIDALPPRLRAMFEVGMTAFRAYTRLRYLRSFCRLARDQRRSTVESWAFGPVGVLRQLFRPIRSTALIAYYELPGAPTRGSARKLPVAVAVVPGSTHG